MKKNWGAGPRAESLSDPGLVLAQCRVDPLARSRGTLLYPRHLGLPPLRLVLAQCRVDPLARLEEDYYSGRAITVIIGSN